MSERLSHTNTETANALRLFRGEPVRPAYARLASAIAGRRRASAFTWNGQPATLEFSAAPHSARSRYTLSLTLDGRELSVGIDRMPDVSALSASLAGIDIAALPPDLACGVLTVAFEAGLDQLKQKGLDLELKEIVHLAHPTNSETLGWSINRGEETGWMRGSLSGDDEALSHLAQALAKVPERADLDLEALPFQISLCAARLCLSIEEASSLQTSDVVLADLGSWRNGGACEVLIGRRRIATAALAGSKLTIQQLAMSDTATAAIDQLEVELTFVVGTENITLQELRTLSPGACLELNSPTSQGVTICANGRPIGRGELLEVGDRFGVRITELSPR